MRVIGPPDVTAEDIVARMREVIGAKNDAALAHALGLGVNAPSNWRQRNSPPYSFCAALAQVTGVSLDWLIFGRGPQRAGAPRAGRTDRADGSPPARRITQFVGEWDASHSEDETIWLEQHLKRTVPEYAAWLSDQNV